MLNAAHSPFPRQRGALCGAKAKSAVFAFAEISEGGEICFKRDETNFRDLKENPTFAERLCAGFFIARYAAAISVNRFALREKCVIINAEEKRAPLRRVNRRENMIEKYIDAIWALLETYLTGGSAHRKKAEPRPMLVG